jgi:hypothetical protein
MEVVFHFGQQFPQRAAWRLWCSSKTSGFLGPYNGWAGIIGRTPSCEEVTHGATFAPFLSATAEPQANHRLEKAGFKEQSSLCSFPKVSKLMLVRRGVNARTEILAIVDAPASTGDNRPMHVFNS